MSLPTKQASLIPSTGPAGSPPDALTTTIADQIAALTARVEALEQEHAVIPSAVEAAAPAAAVEEEEASAVEEEGASAVKEEGASASVTLKNGSVIGSVGDLSASNVAKMTKTELISVCDTFGDDLGIPGSADRSKKELQAALLEAISPPSS